jgi:hypothetical protein
MKSRSDEAGTGRRGLKVLGVAAGVAAVGLGALLLRPSPEASPPAEPARAAAPEPLHVTAASDEWTSDRPALAVMSPVAPRAPAPPPLPPPVPAPQAKAAADEAKAPPPPPAAAAAALQLAQAAAKPDPKKICTPPAAEPDKLAPAPAAHPLKLHFEPTLSARPADIAPQGPPPPDQERRIRLTELLVQALEK